MILADFSTIPGFDKVGGTYRVAAHTFQGRRDPSNRVTVIMANRLALEQQTGADLIYYNEKYQSFVMVQYKAMEEDHGEAKFRWQAGDQFEKELARMQGLWRQIKHAGMAADPDAFRFATNPFFLKFCPRIVLYPDKRDWFRGMYPLLFMNLPNEGNLGIGAASHKA